MEAAAGRKEVTAPSSVAMEASSAVPPTASSEDAALTAVQTQTDEELARSLSHADKSIITDATSAMLQPSKRRRTTRRSNADNASGTNAVFYGGHQSMSRDQLLDTLVRLLHQATVANESQIGGGVSSMSLGELKHLIFPENYDSSRGGIVEMKKLRSALGHLVYKTGRIGRLVVDVEGDQVCWDLLKDGFNGDNDGRGALVKFVVEEAPVLKIEGGAEEVVDGVAAVKFEEPVDEVAAVKLEEPMDGVGAVKLEEQVDGVGAVKLEQPVDGVGAVKLEEMADPKHTNGIATDDSSTTIKSEEPVDLKDDGTAKATLGDASSSTAAATVPSAALINPAISTATPVPAINPHLNSQLQSLEQYIANLHRTELALRKSLMKAIDKGHGKTSGASINSMLQLSTLSIATAADEVEGMADAEDWRSFLPKKAANNESGSDNGSSGGEGDGKAIKWSTRSASHALIGAIMYRPQSSPLRPSENAQEQTILNKKCHWYRIVSHTPSIIADAEVTVVSGEQHHAAATDPTAASKEARPNAIVQRRMRFRAVPVAESDIDLPHSEEGANGDNMDIDDDDVEYMVLTESQARAGVEAALLHCTIEKKHRSIPTLSAIGGDMGAAAAPVTSAGMMVQAVCQPHPYKNKHGSRIMLTPKPEDGVSQFETLYGIIAGYDIHADETGVKNRLLVLLEKGESAEKNDGEEVDADKNKPQDKKPCAFWSTVIEDDTHGTVVTDIVPTSKGEIDASQQLHQLCSTYEVQSNEFHADSEAYAACNIILKYLKSHSKAGPFLEPVDPIELGIPDYFQVIKEPMDVGLLESELVGGIYNRIPPKVLANGHDEEEYEEDGSDSPIYQMAYGPFYNAMMRIFDNCIQYNGKETWIGNEALLLKKAVEKKTQMVVSKAVWAGQGPKKTEKHFFGGGRSSRGGNKSYAEDVSDVDMYEYESEYEDDYDGGGKRKSRKSKGGSSRARGSAKKKGKEDVASQAVEQPFVVPENAHDFGTGGGGAFPHLKIMTNVNKFSLSNDWSCCYVTDEKEVVSAGNGVDGGGEDVTKKEEDTVHEDEMLMLLQLQQQEEDLSGHGGTMRRSTRARHAPQNYADEELDVSATAAAFSSSSTNQTAVTLPGVEYYLINDERFMKPKKKVDIGDGEEGTESSDPIIPTVCTSRLGAEGVQETIHELFYAKLYHDHSPSALILDSGFGKYANGSFPPYLGRIVPTSQGSDRESITWEIRDIYLIPALRWVLRGLVRSGHLAEVDGSLSDGILDDAPARSASFSAGVVVPSHAYYYNHETAAPYDILDEKEILRKRRNATNNVESDDSSEEEVELSAYEQMRAERVKRNAERLKALGLA